MSAGPASGAPAATGGPAAVDSAAHVVVDDLDGDDVAVGDADRHHLARVLRLRPGEIVTVTDGRGRWRSCEVRVGFGAASGTLSPVGDVVSQARPLPPVTVGFGLVKGDRPEWVVQKLVELGVDRIVPLRCARSVVRWDDAGRGERHVARLRAVAREAVMQSRQCFLPELTLPVRVADVAGAGAGWGTPALAERDGDAPTLDCPFVLVGPEGGWDDQERGAVVARVGLGPNVLRAETAAVAAATALVLLRSGLLRTRD